MPAAPPELLHHRDGVIIWKFFATWWVDPMTPEVHVIPLMDRETIILYDTVSDKTSDESARLSLGPGTQPGDRLEVYFSSYNPVSTIHPLMIGDAGGAVAVTHGDKFRFVGVSAMAWVPTLNW